MRRADGKRRLGSAFVVALGAVVVLLLVDVGVGSLLRSIWPPADPAVIPTALNVTGEQATTHDPRADLPSMSAYPWADAYYRELQQTPYAYWPYTESRPRTFDGRYIHVDGWERRTYRSPDADANAPVVWLLGGSAAWGEGQRDDHTIASQLVRLSEASGEPIVVRNFGQRGWTQFQEMILFEQLLAAEEPPDVVVFYDGSNEINAQSLSVKDVPTHTLVDQYAELISSGVADEYGSTEEPTSWWDGFRSSYAAHSAVSRLAGRVDAMVVPPAGARSTAGNDVYAPDEADADAAVAVYERGRRLSQHLADRDGVEALFVWQPTQPSQVEDHARSLLTPPTVDLGLALADHEDTFVDGVLTNEEGASIAAAALWAELVERLPGERRSATPPTTAPLAARDTVALPPAADGIAKAAAALDGIEGDPCALEQWRAWLGSLRADGATDRDAVATLTQRYLRLLAASASAAPPEDVAEVLSVADQFPELVRTGDFDTSGPLILQLPIIDDPASPFLASFSALSAEIVDACAEGGKG